VPCCGACGGLRWLSPWPLFSRGHHAQLYTSARSTDATHRSNSLASPAFEGGLKLLALSRRALDGLLPRKDLLDDAPPTQAKAKPVAAELSALAALLAEREALLQRLEAHVGQVTGDQASLARRLTARAGGQGGGQGSSGAFGSFSLTECVPGGRSRASPELESVLAELAHGVDELAGLVDASVLERQPLQLARVLELNQEFVEAKRRDGIASQRAQTVQRVEGAVRDFHAALAKIKVTAACHAVVNRGGLFLDRLRAALPDARTALRSTENLRPNFRA